MERYENRRRFGRSLKKEKRKGKEEGKNWILGRIPDNPRLLRAGRKRWKEERMMITFDESAPFVPVEKVRSKWQEEASGGARS